VLSENETEEEIEAERKEYKKVSLTDPDDDGDVSTQPQTVAFLQAAHCGR
jgi:hypothetical protein